MSNKYLEKVASNVSDAQRDASKAWTVWGQQKALKKHGYNPSVADLMSVNRESQFQDPARTLKNQLAIPAAAGAVGGVTGLAANKMLHGRGLGALGALAGFGVGAIVGGVREDKAVKKDHAEILRRHLESGAWKKS